MFKKVLVANRGEIACRIIRTCHKMGIKTVAIYSAADINALHVRVAGEAYFVPETPLWLRGYLNGEAILRIAQNTDVEAIHPGYGFLSENVAFVRRCEEEGFIFIGPPAAVIEVMGDKARALQLAKACGVPTLPRSPLITERMQDSLVLEIVENFIREIDDSSMFVKPSGGGGGLGMELVHPQNLFREEVLPIIRRSCDIAKKAFGNGDIYMEKYLSGASHIEVQIFGDTQGKIVHLFHRDCSIQRRSQKIIEEGPSSKISSQNEQVLYEYALRLARQSGYINAGTAEFLVTNEGEIYFLEMNARLQVEHGVTEMITGFDLVDLQIRVAAGEALPFVQENIHMQGHAIEARIYPETLQKGKIFLQEGSVVNYDPPEETDKVRLDTTLCEGYQVSLDYEPLMGKLICWGKDREDALVRLDNSLASLTVVGVPTNINFIRSIIGHGTFRGGGYHTGFLADRAVLAMLEQDIVKLDFIDLEKRLWQHILLLA